MKRIFKTLAGMACIIGALTASSCSKDEFFGLEGSQVVSASTMYEIAMSQEYTDYAKACLAVTQTMSEEIDTTDMDFYIDEKGKRVFYKDGVYSEYSVWELMEALKKAYPELEKADMTDFNEILQIALANNEALRGFAAEASVNDTKSNNGVRKSMEWLSNVHRIYNNLDTTVNVWSTDLGDLHLDYYYHLSGAVHSAICYAVDAADYWFGGYFWDDYSAVLASSCCAYLPDASEYTSPAPVADFFVIPFPEEALPYQYITNQSIGGIFGGRGTHYLYYADGNYQVYYN